MANSFSEAKKEYFKTLKQYVPIVERVHGGSICSMQEANLL
jgi:hypothetical protein